MMNGYIPCVGILNRMSSYIDTGILPSSNQSIDALFTGTSSGWIFGARNTNSNTSAGQINLYGAYNAASYVGYASQRINLGNNYVGNIHWHNNNNEIEVIVDNYSIANATGQTTAFTGTKSMYLMGLNNAGSNISNLVCFNGFVVYENGTVVHNIIPAYEESSGECGGYDLITDEFHRLRSNIISDKYYRDLFKVTIDHGDGGEAYAKTMNDDLVRVIMGADHDVSSGYDKVKIIAIPEAGYSFINWTDSDGNFVSSEIEYEYSATKDITLTAHFIKKTDQKMQTGFKCMAIKYGMNNYSASMRDDIYAEVITASIKNDAMQKTSSTITVKEMPSVYQSNMPIVLFSPKGKCIYMGIIKSIEGNVITCREPLSIYDESFFFHNNSNIDGSDYTKQSAMHTAYDYMNSATVSNTDITGFSQPLQKRKHYPVYPTTNNILSLHEGKIFNVKTPSLSAGISNLEDYLFSLFDSFGIYVRTKLAKGKEGNIDRYNERHYFELKPIYINELDRIQLSDNVESVQDVQINMEELQTTVLVVFNEAGSAVRGFIGTKKDGTRTSFSSNATEEQLVDFIGYDNYQVNVISSNDDINSLSAKNLSNAMYNHKISFTLDLDNSVFDVDSIQIGQPMNFYYKNQMYYSVVTGIEFDVNENDDAIHSIKFTLGKVRNNLTSKLNLKKA